MTDSTSNSDIVQRLNNLENQVDSLKKSNAKKDHIIDQMTEFLETQMPNFQDQVIKEWKNLKKQFKKDREVNSNNFSKVVDLLEIGHGNSRTAVYNSRTAINEGRKREQKFRKLIHNNKRGRVGKAALNNVKKNLQSGIETNRNKIQEIQSNKTRSEANLEMKLQNIQEKLESVESRVDTKVDHLILPDMLENIIQNKVDEVKNEMLMKEDSIVKNEGAEEDESEESEDEMDNSDQDSCSEDDDYLTNRKYITKLSEVIY